MTPSVPRSPTPPAAPEPRPTFRAIIPAGGAGTRLWPLSRRTHPKFLHDLTGAGRSLLQATHDRLTPLADDVVVVTGVAHAGAVREQLPQLGEARILGEPSPRDSMAAIALAAEVLLRRHGDEDLVVGSFAADHLIADERAFAAAVAAAVRAARGDRLVAIGIRATSPSTAFGYIRTGDALPDSAGEALAVERFVEKPDRDTAEEYLAAGRHLWNAGMYLVRARRLRECVERFVPDLAAGVAEIAAAWDTPQRQAVLERVWPGLPAVSIDHAISEPLSAEGGVAVVPADLGWNDIGDWDAVARILTAGAAGDRVRRVDTTVLRGTGEQVHAHDSPGSLVAPGDATVVLLGIPDAVVVNTGDAILVTTREQAQHLKHAVDGLPEQIR